MKIGSLTEALQFLNIVRERKEGGLPDGRSGGDPRQNPRKQPAEKDEASIDTVKDAINAFSADSQTQASGLTAELSIDGSMLRVVLRDGQGLVLRQLSGAEFLRMREAVSQEPQTRGRGKILDQKL